MIQAVVPGAEGRLRAIAVTTLVSPPQKVEYDCAPLKHRVDDPLALSDVEAATGQQLNPVSFAQSLVSRFTRDVIYTNAGAVLVSVNPYALVNDEVGVPIYDAAVMFRYRRHAL